MSLNHPITHVCSASAPIRHISSMKPCPGVQVTKILVCKLVLHRLDYNINSLLAGCPQDISDELQRVNRLFSEEKAVASHLDLLSMHHGYLWCHGFMCDTSPASISNILAVYFPQRHLLRSWAVHTNLHQKFTPKVGERLSSYARPKQWNTLPFSVPTIQPVPSFTRALKTWSSLFFRVICVCVCSKRELLFYTMSCIPYLIRWFNILLRKSVTRGEVFDPVEVSNASDSQWGDDLLAGM